MRGRISCFEKLDFNTICSEKNEQLLLNSELTEETYDKLIEKIINIGKKGLKTEKWGNIGPLEKILDIFQSYSDFKLNLVFEVWSKLKK